MKKIIKSLKKKLVNEICFYCYWLVKKTGVSIIIFCKIYKFVSKKY